MHVLRKPRVEQLQKKLINREIDRRDFMAAAAAAGVAPVASSLVSPAMAAEGDMIHYFTWSGYEPVELHQPFFDKHGRSPDWSIFASAEDGLQKIRAGFVADLAHPCVDGVPRWHDAGVVQPIDTSRVSYWDDMFPALHTMNGAVIDGDVYMVITDFGLSSMIYRTDIIEGEESWMYMYDEKYAGRICARNTTASIFVPLKILGYDPMNPTPEQVMEAADMARKQRDLVRFYWDSQTDMEQAIASGECVVAYAWNEALVNLLDQGIPVAFAAPKEGAFGWACGLVRLAAAENDEQMAYDFIDAWLAPETGKFLIEAYGYGHGNIKSFDLVDTETLVALGYDDPVRLMEGTAFWVPMDPAIDELMLETWEDIIAGL
ncbi:MAG: extracellular solute-binding protein [bacterium]|nr:extracellular solute-binding protein [bacterium]MDE0418997.1 extracellular solute-binding protein [bacterium]